MIPKKLKILFITPISLWFMIPKNLKILFITPISLWFMIPKKTKEFVYNSNFTMVYDT